jgi:hypothetical protein
MSASKPLIFSGIKINDIDYSLHLEEGASITIEPVDDRVDDGQTLVSAYDVSGEILVYDSDLLSDSNVNTNTAQAPVKSNVELTGVSGSQTLTVNNVIVNGISNYENNRSAVQLTFSKRAVSLSTAVTES